MNAVTGDAVPEMEEPVAVELLMTPPPEITCVEAARVAREYFDRHAVCTPMAGERDRNFLMIGDLGKSTLKFINPAETIQETDMQISVLVHLKDSIDVQIPTHIEPIRNTGSVLVAMSNHTSTRVRAYSYLEGESGSSAKPSQQLRLDIGRSVAKLNVALKGFEHPAAHRTFLWDTMQVGRLSVFVETVSEMRLRKFIEEFICTFKLKLHTSLLQLRHQVIHNDLSGSNFLVNKSGTLVTGLLDFGDMVYAPIIADLAVAASYQMTDVNDPLAALNDVCNGFASVIPITDDERHHVLDLVVARLVQRVVITEWRASHFPGNREYILRSHSAAAALMLQVMDCWREGVQQRKSTKPFAE
jgi:hydroxylysine kinase